MFVCNKNLRFWTHELSAKFASLLSTFLLQDMAEHFTMAHIEILYMDLQIQIVGNQIAK